MTRPPRESALRFVGRLLDRAVHDTVRHLWPLALPLVALDLFGSVDRGPWTQNWIASSVVAALLNNRVRTILARSFAETQGKRLTFGAAVRYPRGLWFAIADPLDSLPYLFSAGVALPVAAWTMAAGRGGLVAAVVLGISIVIAIVAILLLALVLPMIIGVLAAFLDVVVDGVGPRTAIVRWWRWTYRWRYFGSTLAVAVTYFIMFFGVSFAFSGLLLQMPWLHSLIIMLTDGIADTIAFVLIWHWRKAVLARELGDDLFTELDASAAVTPAVTSA